MSGPNEKPSLIERLRAEGSELSLAAASELADHEFLLDMRWKADMRAIQRWQAATGKTAIWPDHTDLVVWLMEQEKFADALRRIVEWSEAYPVTVFPEPDLKKAHELLQAGGMTLDAISADAMRHVVEGVGKIAREALR